MDRYNGSHKLDTTSYKALTGINQNVSQVGRNLGRLIFTMARMTGFEITGSLHMRHTKTGTELTVRARKGE